MANLTRTLGNILKPKKLKRRDTGGRGDDPKSPTSEYMSLSPKPVAEEFETSQKSQLAGTEREMSSDTPIQDPNGSENITPQINEAQDTPDSALSTSYKLNSAASNLWDVAYDNLRSRHTGLLEHFETIMTQWLYENDIEQGQKLLFRAQENIFSGSNHQERRQLAQDIISACLNARQYTGYDPGLFEFSIETRDVIKPTVCNIQEAALPWAGACLCVQRLLCSPARLEIVSGICHVVSGMAWYTLLPSLLDGTNKDQVKEGHSSSEQGGLRERIINLYQEILLFQARVICSQRNAGRKGKLALVDSNLLSELVNLSHVDVITAEHWTPCFHDKDVKNRIQNLAIKGHRKKVNATGDETHGPEESNVGMTSNILNATDPRNSNRDLDTQSIKSLYAWVSSTSQYISFSRGEARMLWIGGAPDDCRPMVIWSIVHEYPLQRTSNLEPRFLSLSACGTGENEVDSVLSVLRTLIYLVLVDQPLLYRHLTDALKSTGRREFSGFHDVCALTLLLQDIIADKEFESTIFLIGGLDEIEFGVEGPGSFISLIMTTMELSDKVKWLISGSNEWFEDNFDSGDLSMEKMQRIDLDAENDEVQSILNNYYIPSKADQIASLWNLGRQFRNEIPGLLRKASSGSFLRADVACQAIQREDPWHAPDILKQLSQYTDPRNNLYTLLYEKLGNLPFNDSKLCLDVLRMMAAAYNPLNVTELEALLSMPPYSKVPVLVEKCFGFLELRGTEVSFARKTARNFIIKETKSDSSEIHAQITERCLKSVSAYWASDPCESQMENESAPRNYLALYWMRHLCKVDDADCVMDTVINFLTENILKWLDLLVSKKWLSQAQTLISELRNHVQLKLKPKSKQKLFSIVFETHRLVNLHLMIQNKTESTARNTLLFCPINSIIQQTHLKREWPSLEGPPAFKSSWELPIHILEGHADFVNCCAYSYDGKLLASGSDDGTVRLWDTVSGNVQRTFRAFGKGTYIVNDVNTIAFSSTGLIAASDCNIIKVWNISTGIQQTLLDIGNLCEYKPDTIRDVSFSTDGSMLVAPVQNTIIIWRVPSFEVILYQEVRVHGVNIESVRMSKDGSLLGLTSSRHVSIWKLDHDIYAHAVNGCVDDSESGVQARRMLRLQKELPVPACTMGSAAGFAFSPDSKYIATGTDHDYKVCVWDWKSETPPKILTGHTDRVTTVAFSPDGSFLASGSWDRTTRIWREPWDVEQSPIVLNHTQSINGLSFSPSETCIATCSADETVRIWDYGSQDRAQVQSQVGVRHGQNAPHRRPITTITLSEDGKWVASASLDGMICLWDGNSGLLQRSLCEHRKDVQSLTFTHDSRKLISASDDHTVRIWDLDRDSSSRVLHGHESWVRCAALSRNGRLVASGSDDKTVRLWDITQSKVGRAKSGQEEEGKERNMRGVRVLRGHEAFITCVLFSPDGKYVVSGSYDGEILLWEVDTDHRSNSSTRPTIIKEKDYESIKAMTFSADSTMFIASDAAKTWIWNVTWGAGNTSCQLKLTAQKRILARSLRVNSRFPQSVLTERGCILIRDLGNGKKIAWTTPEPWCPYGVEEFGPQKWITCNGKKLIVLPKMYHPAKDHTVRVQGHRVVIGCETGQLLIFRFKEGAQYL